MITRCNHCGTKFEISAELLQSEDPTVRCGECLSEFDARAQQVGGDSIRNYSSVAAGKQVSQHHTRRPSTASVAPTVAQPSPAMASAGTADQYAHISDDDLENAATVVLDHNLSDNNAPAPAYQPAYRPAPASDRINDGFYSPDLSIDSIDDQHYTAESKTPARADRKIDPSISLSDNVDHASLEFERTLALENYSPQADSQADSDVQRSISDQNEGISDDPGSLRDPWLDKTGGDSQDDQTQRLAQDYHAGREWRPDVDRVLDHSKRSATNPASMALADRDYQPINDDLPAGQSDTFEQLDETADPDRHLSPEERGVQQSYDASDSMHPDDTFQDFDADQDSASELRRYVSSSGGAIVSDSDTGSRKKSRRLTSVLKLLLLVCVLCAGALYLARDTIAAMNLPGPVLSAFCAVTGCELPLQKDVAQLELIRHQMFSHKTLDDVLVFTVDLINRARFPQPYPVLVVTMANSGGESVAFRKFQPDEYLEEDPTLTRLPAGKPVRIKFEIVDPGPEALSSELSFE